MEIAGKRALVTGASSGIGRSLATQLAMHGAHLGLVARRGDLLEQLADEVAESGASRPVVLISDLASRGAAAALAAATEESLGPVDILVNNAGLAVRGYQMAVGDRDEGRDVFEVNVWSPAALTAALVPAMRGRRTGAIVNVTSLMQVTPWPTVGYYTASKAALASLTETLRLELRGSGVQVLEVIPGPVATPMQGESMLIPGFARAQKRVRVGNPDTLARLVIRALRRGRSRLVYPRSLRVAYSLAPLMRRFSTVQVGRLAAEFNPNESQILRSGSHGDDVARRAREAWEQGERDPAKLQGLASTPRD